MSPPPDRGASRPDLTAVRFSVPADLAEEAFARLRVAPPRDHAGLTALYRAFLAEVPFDNLTKAVALRAGRPNTEGDPESLLGRWVRDGLGGTCWSLVAAFAALCEHGGLPASASIERARWVAPPQVDLHGAVVVRIDERRYLCDVVHPSGAPLRIVPGEHGALEDYGSGLALAADGALEHWFAHPEQTRPDLRYRMLSTDAGPEDVASLVAVAEVFSGVGVERPRWRRSPAEGTTRVSAPDGSGRGWAVVRWSGGRVRTREVVDALEAFAVAGARQPRAQVAQVAEAWPDLVGTRT